MSEFDPIQSVIQGDCLKVLKELPSGYFDALITDPPAGIAFMACDWDKDKGGMLAWVNWLSEVMGECLRCLKPGGVGVVWSIPRTCGWTQLALELSGFRVIDSISIINGSGFPKAQDISKGIDKHFGHERNGKAEQWDGWKTPALKPAVESWFLVQRPCDGSIVRNVLTHGVGGLNIEAARIGQEISYKTGHSSVGAGSERACNVYDRGDGKTPDGRNYQKIIERQKQYALNADIQKTVSGRYPSNCILIHSPECTDAGCVEHCPVEILNRQTDGTRASKNAKHGTNPCIVRGHTAILRGAVSTAESLAKTNYEDAGNGNNAARYFKQLPFDHNGFRYFTKASPSDRSINGAVDNVHPTVKNTALMEYFAKLICPLGGIVLDPFGGSGSTAIGCLKAGMQYTLIEREPEYIDIIKSRISAYRQHVGMPVEESPSASGQPNPNGNVQLDLFSGISSPSQTATA